MVTFKHAGRLGNVLFEIAATIGYAYRHNIDFTVPSTTSDAVMQPVYMLHLVNPDWQEWWDKIEIKEQTHAYHELHWEETWRSKNIILDGYFQSEKYFAEYRKEILKLFRIPYRKKKNTVGIHVRRGDYLLYPTRFPVCKPEYYLQAVEHFKQLGYRKFLVSSDDITWCKDFFSPNNFKGFKAGLKFSFLEKGPLLDKVSLISSCEHQINSNSTLSWWMAWLNQNINKIVITPDESNWFGPDNAHINVSDIIPKEWMRIKF